MPPRQQVVNPQIQRTVTGKGGILYVVGQKLGRQKVYDDVRLLIHPC